MELGQRILQARLEAGLSQRQLCGDTITRNMLSQMEHGTVQPSLATLRFLAQRLGKPVSYFLEEEAVLSPNVQIMAQARQCFGAEDYDGVLEKLKQYHRPDPVFDWEQALLEGKANLALAKQAMGEGKHPYAMELLHRVKLSGGATAYFGEELERERLLLLALAEPPGAVVLPADDRQLIVRARIALAEDNPGRCAQILDAAEEHNGQEWSFLRGEAHFALEEYAQAADCYQRAERKYPKETAKRLERCFYNLEDYKMAYFYACKQRED